MIEIAPSMLSADFGNLDRDVEMVNRSEASWMHLDVMDGVFVPNISYGFPVIKAIGRNARKPLDAHLMIVNPGFGGQKFIDLALPKVRRMRGLIDSMGLATRIEVDGGVNMQTGKLLADAGADILVAGSFVFGADDPEATIASLRQL